MRIAWSWLSGFLPVFLDRLLDGAEDRMAGLVLHLDAHDVAEAHERRLRPALLDRLDGADLGDAGIADAALGDRLARPAVELVRHRARADDRAGDERAGLRGMGDQGREVEG